MKKCFQWPLLVFLVSCFLICGFLKDVQAQVDLKSKIDAGEYVQRVNNCMVIIDASYSMANSYNGQKKLTLAKETAMLMNNTIPDIDLQIALRKFGQKNWQLGEDTELVYDLGGYSREEFEEAINKVKRTMGRSPLHLAIDASTKDLEETQGETAVIIFSDGQNMGDLPIQAAERMKRNLCEKVCIYTVQIGDNEKGKECLENIAQASECGFLTNADEISSDEAMADFVAKIFLNKVADTDGDGVPDSIDKCPDTPEGVTVDESGCPLDADGDGVPDYLDKCPDTPQGVIVDTNGCPPDSDGDGVSDQLDKCPNTPKGVMVDAVGCPLDSDGDGIADYLDKCPNTPKGVKVDKSGCPLDTDGDGVPDYLDKCPGTPKGVKVDTVGCPLDSDGDGVSDQLDKCPNTPKGVMVDAVGCPLDSDGDGIADYLDKCPNTPKGVKVDKSGCPLDTDGDGVPDYLDKCPGTPKGVKVDTVGCPLDSDGDGVPDYLDLCPDTPKGAKADERGCWVIRMDNIGFDFDKWDLKPKAYPVLNEVVSILKTDPKLKIEIQGHTCNIGTKEYNKKLSEKRAQAVRDYLIKQGIENDRLSAKGFWFSKPAASNLTKEGRAKNRRVEFQPIR